MFMFLLYYMINKKQRACIMQERILFTMDICLIVSCVKDEVLQSETIKHKHSCIHIS